MNLNEKFGEELLRIKRPEIFLGVARILKVQLLNDANEPRDFSELFVDVIDFYAASPRKRKRELLKILREANSAPDAPEVSNGN